MLDRIGSLLRPRSAPLFVFVAVFIAVFFLVVVTTTVVTFIMPESYASRARVMVRQDASEATRRPGPPASVPNSYDPYFVQTQFELMQSEAILGKVVEDLDLNHVWGKKIAGGETLKTSESLALLKMRLALRPVRNTSLIEICAYSEDPAEAAALANAIAEAYRAWSLPHKISVEFVETALPGIRPVRPNKPLNIALGVIIGGFVAVVAGAGLAGVAAMLGRRSRASAPPGAGEALGEAPPPVPPLAAGSSARSPDPRDKQAAANPC